MAEKNRKEKTNTENRSQQAPASGAAGGARPSESFAERQKLDGTASPRILRRETEKLDASTEEEVDALRVNLRQDDEHASTRDSSGLIVDELAEERIAKFTEVGPLSGERGAESLVPGRDNTSSVLRRHHPDSSVARAEDVVEGNLEEPREESRGERKVDEGTAA